MEAKIIIGCRAEPYECKERKTRQGLRRHTVMHASLFHSQEAIIHISEAPASQLALLTHT